MRKKVLVAGYFDLFHVGHVQFFKEANKFGDVYVSIGTDENSEINKNKIPIYNEEERKFLVENCKYVKEADISYGQKNSLSFIPYLEKIKPDIFITNEDGDSDSKRELCKKYNIEYVVLKRLIENLPIRSSTSIRNIDRIPLRLDLVGFYDQKYFNSVLPGSVILANIETLNVEDRSGMSSSTRKLIRKIFGNSLPKNLDRKELAKIIFSIENPIDSKYISGVVDQLGISLPGINKLDFDNNYWPYSITSIDNNEAIAYLSKYLYLVQTKPRPDGFNLFDGRENFSFENVNQQRLLGIECWESIKKMNIERFAKCINNVHENQKRIIPNYESEYCKPIIKEYQKNHMGVKLMGAGGYGYAMIVTDKPEKSFMKINITNI